MLAQLEKPFADSVDDIDLICLGYAGTIKKLFACRETRVKFGISKLLMEAELEEQLVIDAHSAHIASTTLSHLSPQSTISMTSNPPSITSHCSSGRTSLDFSSYSYSPFTAYDA